MKWWWSTEAVQGRARARENARLKKAEALEEKKLRSTLSKEATYYTDLITAVAANRGFLHVLRGLLAPEPLETLLTGKSPIMRLKFTHVLMEPARLWLRIDATCLPTPVELADLKRPEFLETLSVALKRTVKYEWSTAAGAFFIVERDGSIAGIPNYVKMEDAFSWVPENADPLTYCVGLAEGRRPLIVTLTQLPHLLIAGTTGSGKSVNVNDLICTVARRASPSVVRFAMIDLKSGLEFKQYEMLPHLLPTEKTEVSGIAYTVEEAKIVIKTVIDEIKIRGPRFRDAGTRNIDEYRKARPDDPLPYIVLIIDELALLLFNMDKELVKIARILMFEVLATGRAYGIHVVVCMQEATRQILPRELKGLLPGRISFRAASIASSIAVLENKQAHRLSPRGRGVFQFDEEIPFQGPYLSTKMVNRYVKGIREKWSAEPAKGELGLKDLMLYALDQRKGSLAWDPLYTEFKEKGLSADRIKSLLKSADGRQFEIDGWLYKVDPPKKGDKSGRRLRKIAPALTEGEGTVSDSLAAD